MGIRRNNLRFQIGVWMVKLNFDEGKTNPHYTPNDPLKYFTQPVFEEKTHGCILVLDDETLTKGKLGNPLSPIIH